MKNKTKTGSSFAKLFRDIERMQQERKRKAGKHRCKWKRSGTVSRLTNGDKILKRPVVQAYFYEFELCWEMKLVPKKRK